MNPSFIFIFRIERLWEYMLYKELITSTTLVKNSDTHSLIYIALIKEPWWIYQYAYNYHLFCWFVKKTMKCKYKNAKYRLSFTLLNLNHMSSNVLYIFYIKIWVLLPLCITSWQIFDSICIVSLIMFHWSSIIIDYWTSS